MSKTDLSHIANWSTSLLDQTHVKLLVTVQEMTWELFSLSIFEPLDEALSCTPVLPICLNIT